MSSTGYNLIPPPLPSSVASLAGLIAVAPVMQPQASQPSDTTDDLAPMPIAEALAVLDLVVPGFSIEFEASRAAISDAGRVVFDRAFDDVRRELGALQRRWIAASGTAETFGAYLRVACPPDLLALHDTPSIADGVQ